MDPGPTVNLSLVICNPSFHSSFARSKLKGKTI
jgi:hypothetical protein